MREIAITLRQGEFEVRDDGRGIGLHRAGYVENLMGTLTGGPGPVQLHGVGLAMVAASVPRLEVESRRDGEVFRLVFEWGVPQGGVARQPAPDEARGTRMIAFLPDRGAEPDMSELARQIDAWKSMHPDLIVHVR